MIRTEWRRAVSRAAICGDKRQSFELDVNVDDGESGARFVEYDDAR
jgi:hypothetical protein